MEYITLKNSDLRVSRICMGGCPMGGYGWGEPDEEGLICAVHRALEEGINFFDTADTYGFGRGEEILAEGLGACRKDVVVQSKFGVRVMEDMVGRKTLYDNSPDYIRKALEGTLRRLGSDYVDIYTIHYRDRDTDIRTVIDALKELRAEGKIRHFGLSNIHRGAMDEIKPYSGSFVCCQDEYSLAKRDFEDDLMSVQKELGVTPLTWGSLGQGILTGKYGRDSTFGASDRRSRDIYVNFHGEKLRRNLEIVDVMRGIAESRGKPVSAVAIRFILDRLPDSVVLAGAKTPSQIDSNIEGCGWGLSGSEMEALLQASSSDCVAV